MKRAISRGSFSRSQRTVFIGAAVALLVFGAGSSSTAPPALKPRPTPVSGKGDPELAKAWYLDRIGAERAWEVTTGDADTIVAIVDSGINYNHPDLAANLIRDAGVPQGRAVDYENPDEVENDPAQRERQDQWGRKSMPGWDFVRSNGLPFDRSGHGTFLAGVIAAAADNGIGARGICSDCRVLTARFLNHEGLGDTEDAIKSLYYSVDNGAKVINFSFAGEGADNDLKDAMEYAADHDVLIVVSAANDAENVDRSSTYPAKYNLPNQITVASTNKKDQLTERSNWGKKTVHLAAPGEDIYSTWFDQYADDGEGTSIATAVVSGAAALIRSAAPRLSAVQVRAILERTARPVAGLREKLVTGGVLDLGAAMECATQSGLPCLRARSKSLDE